MGYWIERVEQVLSEWYQKDCVLFKRATTGIYVLLKVKGFKKVVYPATLCPSPAIAALYANTKLEFLDVNLEDYTMDYHGMPKDAEAILAVHLYGHISDISKIPEPLFIIEDAAQAMGSEKICSSDADATILSFGDTKLVEIGFGGAVLVDNTELAKELRIERAAIPVKNIGNLQTEYSHVYHKLQELVRINPSLYVLFSHLPYIYRDLYVNGLSEIEAKNIYDTLVKENINEKVLNRRTKFILYKQLLNHPYFTLPKIDPSSVPWKFTCLINKENVFSFSDKLREKGLDVSNNFFSIPSWYGDNLTYPNSKYLESHVINLPLDESISENQIKKYCEVILKTLEEEGGTIG